MACSTAVRPLRLVRRNTSCSATASKYPEAVSIRILFPLWECGSRSWTMADMNVVQNSRQDQRAIDSNLPITQQNIAPETRGCSISTLSDLTENVTTIITCNHTAVVNLALGGDE